MDVKHLCVLQEKATKKPRLESAQGSEESAYESSEDEEEEQNSDSDEVIHANSGPISGIVLCV